MNSSIGRAPHEILSDSGRLWVRVLFHPLCVDRCSISCYININEKDTLCYEN